MAAPAPVEVGVGASAPSSAPAPQEHHEEPNFEADDAGRSSSESDDDQPFLDPYWASLLNVTKTDDPLPPPKKGDAAAAGKDGKDGEGKGRGKGGKFGAAAGGKGWKGGKGGRKGGKGHGDGVGDFLSWAMDPGAEDGSRPRSRSPRRQQSAGGLQSFMSWAKDDRGVKEEEAADPEAARAREDLASFMAWASADGPVAEVDAPKAEEEGDEPKASKPVPSYEGAASTATEEALKDPPKDPVAEDEAAGVRELVVSAEMEEQLRAMDRVKRRKGDSDSEQSDAEV